METENKRDSLRSQGRRETRKGENVAASSDSSSRHCMEVTFFEE